MTEEGDLKRHHDEDGRPTGLYECSICGELFKPNPANQGEMRTTFVIHRETAHKAQKKPREDVNQAAARVVKEIAERD
jgi:hypothetical protein